MLGKILMGKKFEGVRHGKSRGVHFKEKCPLKKKRSSEYHPLNDVHQGSCHHPKSC